MTRRAKSTHRTSFRVLSLILSILILVSIWVPCVAIAAEVDNRVVDPSTMDNWNNYFGSSVFDTSNAGGVWTDKSVFTSADQINQQLSMKDPDNNFMVALSAIASNKSIKGYTNLPSDTMLVLDVSGSMAQDQYDRDTSEKIDAMVKSTNEAIKKLLDLNYYNRVGVVLYSGSTVTGSSATSTATVLLPLDRYTLSGNVSNYITYSTSGGLSVSLTNGVVNSKGNKLDVVKKNVTGGTYIQNALDKAWDEFYAVEDTTITDLGPQAGTTRIPIMVLMSDGAATTATNNYTSIGASNIGVGTSTDSTMGFAVQLTASYVKKMMEDKYERSPLFYTLGLGLDHLSGNGEADIAKSVLDPENSTKAINDNWTTFKTLKSNQTMVLSSRNSSNRVSNFSFYGNNLINGIIEETNEIDETEYQYYVDKYFEADDAQELINAFTAIVEEIIIQSRYYPTLSEPGNHDLDGYITFEDKIGEYMEVKDVKGLLLGDKYYSGAMMASNFSSNGDLGTIENPTALGDEFIRAVKARMGIDTATAQALVAEAYTYNQLYYNSDTDFGNCIQWYEDANGNYCGFHYDGQPASEIPNGAVAYNCSYGFLGETEGSIKDSDMMYVSVKTRTDLTTGEQTMYWMIPASLVPVVNYDISMDGIDPETAENITLTRNDADPIRLVYEVGLKDEINPLTVADYVDDDYGYIENGEYVFYTNKWSNGSGNPLDHTKTVVDFSPSVENERYYFIEDRAIYERNGEVYEMVDNAPAVGDGNTYYHERYVYKANENGGAATYESIYEVITNEALAEAVKNEDGIWCIPKGTAYKSDKDFVANKTENATGTLYYTAYPYTSHPTEESPDYTDYLFLGNNGKIKLTPAQGIELSKAISTYEDNTSTEFEFEITLEGDNIAASYPCTVITKDGETVKSTVNVNDGVINVPLSAGEKIYITDIAEGTTYTITEKEHPDYKVETVNGEDKETATGTIEAFVLDEVNFVNTLKTTGHLIIGKQVQNTLANHTLDKDIAFKANVKLVDENKDPLANATFETNRTVTVTTDSNGCFTLTLKDGETVAIIDIPEGSEYTVEEINIPNGFTLSDKSAGLNGTIKSDENAVATLVNVYTPDSVNPNINVTGTKTLNGRPWLDTDVFNFELQRLDGNQWVTIAETAVDTSQKTFDFTEAMKAETFNNIGLYQYRVIEIEGELGGVTYDTTYRLFNIYVTDNNSDGKLEINRVDPVNTTIVEQTETGWNVVANYTNTYRAQGTARVLVDIQKILENETGVEMGPDGFTFGLYDEDGDLLIETEATDTEGKTTFDINYTPDAIGKVYNYTIKEIVPEDAKQGMIYSTEEYKLTIEIKDNYDGTFTAIVENAVEVNEQGARFEAEFTNKYDPADATLVINGTKELEGRNLNDAEFSFNLYEADEEFNIIGTEIANVTNDAEGAFEFNELTFDKIGTYNYVVKEDTNTKLGGVTYDDAVYNVTVTVTDNNEGTLVATTEITKEDETVDEIKFTNTYTAKPVNVNLDGYKLLLNKELESDEFTFELYEADEVYNIVGTAVKTAKNAKDGKFTFENLLFEEVGVYFYVVKEVVPNDTKGVTYDTTNVKVAIEVDDDGLGALYAKTVIYKGDTVADAINFTNEYNAEYAKVTLEGTKTLNGKDLAIGEFEFELYEADENFAPVGNPLYTATNAEDGTFKFANLRFEDIGVYNYIVKEVVPENTKGIIYDTTNVKVTVNVKDNGLGALYAETVIYKGDVVADTISFTNEYVPQYANVTLTGTKVLEGKDLEANEFTFELYEADEVFNIVDTAIKTATNTEDGTFAFENLRFDDIGVYFYVVKEVVPEATGDIVYDNTEYLVKIYVTDNMQGNLTADVEILVNETPVEAIVFTNTYNPPTEPPTTEPPTTEPPTTEQPTTEPPTTEPPTKPTEPAPTTKPTTPTQTQPKTTNNAPIQTGDINYLVTFIIIMLACSGIIIFTVPRKKDENTEE